MTQKYIYCENCEAIRPLVEDAMYGKDTSGRFINPTDLMCAECRLVIATTYDLPYGDHGG